MPVNGLLIRGLLNLYQFYGDDFKVECPTGSGRYMTLFEVAKEIGSQAIEHFSPRCQWQAARLWGNQEVSGRPALERLHFVLRVFPRGQRRGAGSQSPNWLDGNYRSDARSVCPDKLQPMPSMSASQTS